MILLRALCLLLIAPTVIWAQSSPENLDSSTNKEKLAGEVKALREALLQTQKQVAVQQREIETLKARSNAGSLSASNRPSPVEGEASASDSASASIQPASGQTTAYVRQQPARSRKGSVASPGVQDWRRSPDSRRIRRPREYFSHHQHAEQHRHVFCLDTLQQHTAGKYQRISNYSAVFAAQPDGQGQISRQRYHRLCRGRFQRQRCCRRLSKREPAHQPSAAAEPGTIIGYGGSGSANTNNRAIQQATFDWLQTFWKDTRYGALQSYIQYSYLTRAPWFVAPDAPKNAHLSMVYFGVRYVLPSTSGTLLRVPYPN